MFLADLVVSTSCKCSIYKLQRESLREEDVTIDSYAFNCLASVVLLGFFPPLNSLQVFVRLLSVFELSFTRLIRQN